jgi:farnesyl diphosphate synthase
MKTINKTITPYQERINTTMLQYLPEDPARLSAAMRYSLCAGGKRLRPALLYATGTAFGSTLDACDRAAAAVEYIHTYSLIHDDLPAMDNDDLRRGKPTCHIAYDEATAILAGDALQALAFEVLSTNPPHTPYFQNKMIQALASAISANGMVGGQVLDMAAENTHISLDEISKIHTLKTAALIRASILLGAYCAGVDDTDTLQYLTDFSLHIGLAFQIQDDILDIEGNTTTLGKPAQSDLEQHKATYPSICGLETSKRMAAEHFEKACDALKKIDIDTRVLASIAVQMIDRSF